MGFFDNGKPTAEQELFMLKGRVEATIAAIKAETYINKETILVMLGSKPNVKVPIAEPDSMPNIESKPEVEPETETDPKGGTEAESDNW